MLGHKSKIYSLITTDLIVEVPGIYQIYKKENKSFKIPNPVLNIVSFFYILPLNVGKWTHHIEVS